MALPKEKPATPIKEKKPPKRTNQRPKVAIIGGGIAGLAAAYSLANADKNRSNITIFESTDVLGGKLQLHEVGGHQLDAGAESVLAARPEALELLRQVGLGSDLIEPSSAQASIWRGGKLRTIPKGLVGGVPTDLQALAASDIVSLPGLLRIPLDHVIPQTVIEDDVSVGEYVGARLGREVVDALVEPLVGGTYAGWSDDLSMEMTLPALYRLARHERSLIEAAHQAQRAGVAPSGTRSGPVNVGVRGGLARLVGAIEKKLKSKQVKIKLGTTVTSVKQQDDGWRIQGSKGSRVQRFDFDAVVLAVPAPAASKILNKANARAASILERFEYSSLAIVTLIYDRSRVPDDLVGSGFLVPPDEGFMINSGTFISKKWDATERQDDDFIVRVSMGRFGQSELLQESDDDLTGIAIDELNALVGLPRAVKDAKVVRWGGALPQYMVGHRSRVTKIRELLIDTPGLVICGSAYDGVGVAACVGSGNIAAGQVTTYLKDKKAVANV